MRTIEISVGAFMLAGLLALVFLAVRVSGINEVGASAETFTLKARFEDVAGLTTRAKVSIAGVRIGRVTKVEVDPEYGQAIVTMAIDKQLSAKLPADTGAKILTEGILGGKYIGLSLGGADEALKDGDEITDTQSAFVLENLIGDLVTRMGGGDSK
jgi:phospholipid/cholesterol/gamma-HCH transport system substrate-binding protein